MDASQYKDYVLFMLFINYISDKTWSTGLTRGSDPCQRLAWGEPPGKQAMAEELLTGRIRLV